MGESTFMVEMNETASILNNLSDRSLVLLDEIEEEPLLTEFQLHGLFQNIYMNIQEG